MSCNTRDRLRETLRDEGNKVTFSVDLFDYLGIEKTMTTTDIVDLSEGLVTAEHGIKPPFCIVVPQGTNLKQQYIDGIDDLGTLEERLLRIPNVKAVRVGRSVGLTLEHYER